MSFNARRRAALLGAALLCPAAAPAILRAAPSPKAGAAMKSQTKPGTFSAVRFPSQRGKTGWSGWARWAPRAEIAPCFDVRPGVGPDGDSALSIQAQNASDWGLWRRRVEGIQGGKTYRFAALYQAQDVPRLEQCVRAQVEWLDDKGQPLRAPDFAALVQPADGASANGGWDKLALIAQAPPEARAARLGLSFGWAVGGSVLWGQVELREQAPSEGRIVRALTIYARPSRTASSAQSVEEFCRRIQESASLRPDIVCLPEGITLIGTGKSVAQVSEPLRGPTSKRLGREAKKLGCYIVAGIYEREGAAIYNTALLIGRDGQVAGSYRKTHLPREEAEAGLSPGSEYPVFETDFGRVGLLICWDVQFPEPARALALRGAEVILLPIWGGSEELTRARAIENHVFLISSSYDMRSMVLDPTGQVLAEATKDKPLALAELHLDRAIVQPWLGNMKPRTQQERRPDLQVEPQP